jgi:hypothetical protein
MTTYTCKQCGAAVKLVKAVPTKTCGCPPGIIAHLKARATGEGKTAA